MFLRLLSRSQRRSLSTTQHPAIARQRRFAALPLRLEELEPRVVPAAHFFTVPGAATTQVTLEFDWTAREAAFNNETGVYQVTDTTGTVGGIAPGQAGYAALATTNSQVVFASGTGAGATRQLTFAGGTQLGFFIVQDSSTASLRNSNPQDQANNGPAAFFSFDAANFDHFDHTRTTTFGDGREQFIWEDLTGGGDQDFNDVVFTVGVAGARAIPTPGLAGQTVPTQFTWTSRDAAFNNELGVFNVDAADGHIGTVKPGDANYASTALNSASRKVLFASGQGAGATASANLPGGGFVGLYLVQNSTTAQALATNPNDQIGGLPLVFFSFPKANPDAFDHLRWLSATDFAFEDGTNGGDQDFNDLVAHLSFGTPQGTPAPQGATLTLDPGSDTGTKGDNRTDLAAVTLTGTTLPNAKVVLSPTNTSTTSDAAGRFSFGVSLNQGANTFSVTATDTTGQTAQGSATITRTNPPTVLTALTDAAVPLNAPDKLFNLANNFNDADMTGTTVHFDTIDGPIDLQLFDQQAPRTVQNFLSYVTRGAFTDSIFHRSVPNFVLQGGGFVFNANPSRLDTIPTDPAVLNEFGMSNLRGTISMAKLGSDPNSATDEFFFNLANNSSNLDHQNGGFTVFGQVVGNGLQVIDALATIPTQDKGGNFTTIPLINYTGNNFPTDTTKSNFAIVNSVTVTHRGDQLTYTVVGNTNPTVVTPSISGQVLTLHYPTGQTGASSITIRATDQDGSFVDTTFKVTVGP